MRFTFSPSVGAAGLLTDWHDRDCELVQKTENQTSGFVSELAETGSSAAVVHDANA